MSAEAALKINNDMLTPSSALWDKMRKGLRDHIGETAYQRWFKVATASIASDNGKDILSINLPTRFMRDWVEAHYGDTVRTLWQHISSEGRVEFTVITPPTRKITSEDSQPLASTSVPLAAIPGKFGPSVM